MNAEIVGKTFFHVTASDVVHVMFVKELEDVGTKFGIAFYAGLAVAVYRDGRTYTESWKCDKATFETRIASGYYQPIN